jgi:uncharacterized protein (TIGR02118 family)
MNKRQFLASALTAAAGTAGYASSARAQTAPMAKIVFFFQRLPGMSFEDFSRYWREQHGPIGAAMPGVRKYIQNHAAATLDGSPPAYDGFAELWFDDMESLQQALASPESQAAMADSENFLDMERIQTLIVEEVPVV